MSFSLSTGLRNGMLGTTGFREMFTNGTMYLYSGAMPTNADAAVSGTLLGKVTESGGTFVFGTATNGLNFDAAASGVIAKAAAESWEYTGLADGTVGWVRLMGNATDALGSSTTLARLDISVASAGTGVIVFANTAVVTGAPGVIQALTFSLPVR